MHLRCGKLELTLNGCVFHHTHAIWRKIQSLGLQEAYNRRAATFNFCRRLMALAFLPAEYIPAQFEAIRCTNATGKFVELLDYFQRQWLNNTTIPVKAWSVFGRPIRTNNNVEGWHKRINSQAHSQQSINMYLLIDTLYKESVNVNLQIQFLSNGAVLRYQRAKYRKLQAIIFKAWQNLSDGEISAKQLLKLCSRLNGPTISMNSPDTE